MHKPPAPQLGEQPGDSGERQINKINRNYKIFFCLFKQKTNNTKQILAQKLSNLRYLSGSLSESVGFPEGQAKGQY